MSRREELPQPYLCLLEEQEFTGYGFNYSLSLNDDISSRKDVTRKKIAAGVAGNEGDIYILSQFSPAAHNEYKTSIDGFIGTPSNIRDVPFRETRIAQRGLYLGLDFRGSWDEFILLSNNVYLKYLPQLGLYRRQGFDIERFARQNGVGFANHQPVYSIHYFVPVGYI